MLEHLGALGAHQMRESHIPAELPRMSVVEARKLLGRKYSHLSDNQVQVIINTLTLIARESLKL